MQPLFQRILWLFTLLVKYHPVVTVMFGLYQGFMKKDRLYLTLVTLSPELCQLVLVWLITEVFVMYSPE